MALRDLTPQLRTRLSRVERAVGWFVLLAMVLLLFGFAYYVYATAQRKGWLKIRVPYFTLVDRATGLRVGDPVVLMGFEVGQITGIKPQPPEDFTYNVYVEFEVWEPNYGYLWTIGSVAKVVTADLLGKRVLEVTKGSGGHATYVFHPLREVDLSEAQRLPEPEKWKLAQDLYVQTGTNLVLALKAFTPLNAQNLTRVSALGHPRIRVFDTREQRNRITAVWDDKQGRYEPWTKTSVPYWLPAEESPAVTERLEKLVAQVENALPGFFTLTNDLADMLVNGTQLASNLNSLAASATPVVSNLVALSSQLREPGSLGEWALGADGRLGIQSLLNHADLAITRTDTNLSRQLDNLGRTLDNLADITSNLNAQVQSNTNVLTEISAAILHADELMLGLKRHWLLRSAFRGNTNTAPSKSKSPLLPPRAREASH